MYATDEIEIEYDDDDTAAPLTVTIRGGLMARRIKLSRDIPGPATVTVIHDERLLRGVLNEARTRISPLIDIGHWEEQY